MMSSEEESKCLGLYGDKLLKKRQRQRVDAGEPRNSYSSIPNFSSRPSFLSGSPYEQLFSQQPQSHIGFLGQGFAQGSAKMLNELLGRQVKAEPCALGVGGVGGVGPAVGDVDCYSGAVGGALGGALGGAVGVMIRRGLVDEDHMLRDILQGRKKELLALEQELQAGEHDPVNNNNTLANNNNDLKNGGSDDSEVCGVSAGASGNKLLNGSDMSVTSGPGAMGLDDPRSRSPRHVGHVAAPASADDDKQTVNVNGDASGNGAESDSDTSVHSTASTTDAKDVTDDVEEDDDKKSSGSGVDLKRKRVENIVSTMARSSPLPQPVNGCKKRKLYHPQQHDAGLGVAMGMQALMMDDQDEENTPALRQKQAEKSVLKSQLRTMQEKLVEMQHQYVQLCSRMEQVDTQDQDQDMDADADVADDNASDILEPEQRDNEQDQDAEQDMDAEQDQDQDADQEDADNSLSLSEKTGKDDSSPPATPVKETSHADRASASAPTTPSSATSPVVKQMAPPKIHPHHGNPMFPPHPMQLALLQQQHLAAGGDYHPHHPHHPHHPQHHPSALSMYLGVSHKLFLEQQAAKAEAAEHQRQQHERNREAQQQQQQQQIQQQQQSSHQKDFSERFAMFRNAPVDLDGLADVLKSEISTSVGNLVDSIVSRYMQQRRFKPSDSDQLNKDLLLASQLLDRKSPRTKVLGDSRGANGPRMNGGAFGPSGNPNTPTQSAACPPSNGGDIMPPHVRPSPNAMMFPTPKLPNAAAAALYSMSGLSQGLAQGLNPFGPEPRDGVPEQNEALSLVVTAKKKRHKVTDTRITPRTVSRILAQEGMLGPLAGPLDGAATPQPQHPPPSGSPRTPTGTPQPQQQQQQQQGGPQQPQQQGLQGLQTPPQQQQHPQQQRCPSGVPGGLHRAAPDSPPPPSQRPYHPHGGHGPPPMLPVSLPTSVAIPNPGLHESQVFSPYSPFYSHVPHMSASPPLPLRDSPPPLPPLLHPALMAATHAHHGGSPDYGVLRGASGLDSLDRSDCNSGDGPYDGMSPSMSFNYKMRHDDPSSLSGPHSSTLTPMHLRKAKLMFFWVRYPSSAVLKMYFPDIKFNKNNTAQLVKWFSNFREFYYIQMEKYARQAVSEGVKAPDDLRVLGDSEIYRVLNLHYNRNNHIEVPQNFRYVVEQTLKEFYKAIQTGKDSEPSWKKSIYKVISRMDDPVPEYFKSPNFLEQLE